jgi:hypothetical protein
MLIVVVLVLIMECFVPAKSVEHSLQYSREAAGLHSIKYMSLTSSFGMVQLYRSVVAVSISNFYRKLAFCFGYMSGGCNAPIAEDPEVIVIPKLFNFVCHLEYVAAELCKARYRLRFISVFSNRGAVMWGKTQGKAGGLGGEIVSPN